MLTRKYTSAKLDEFAELTHSGAAKSLKAENEGRFFNFLDDERFLPNVPLDVKYELVTDELMDVVNRGNPYERLTQKYHAEKSLWYLKHLSLVSKIEHFNSLAPEERDVEEGAVLIAMWFQPSSEFTAQDVKSQLDKLAQDVRQILYTVNANHRLFAESPLVIPEKLTASMWSPAECRQILHAISTLVSSEFNQNLEQYFAKENSFINLVLEEKNAIPITLCLIVQAIAKRLGVVLETVSFPRHFLLRWLSFPTRSGVSRYLFVDPFNEAYFLTYEDLVETFNAPEIPVREEHCEACSNQEVLERMLRNLVNIGKHSQSNSDMHFLRYTVELYSLFSPLDVEMSVLSVQIKLHLKVNLMGVLNALQEMQAVQPGMTDLLSKLQQETERMLEKLRNAEPKLKPAKHRSDNPDVLFSTGMVMRHKRYNYTCVIYGWDSTCQASAEWVMRMGVNKLTNKTQQPFYHVFVMDGSDRYAAQESLTQAVDARKITHPEVGRYFDTFTGSHYKANRMLQEVYPDDVQVTQNAAGLMCDQ